MPSPAPTLPKCRLCQNAPESRERGLLVACGTCGCPLQDVEMRRALWHDLHAPDATTAALVDAARACRTDLNHATYYALGHALARYDAAHPATTATKEHANG